MTNHPHGSGVCEECGNCIIPDCLEHAWGPEYRAVLLAAIDLNAAVADMKQMRDTGLGNRPKIRQRHQAAIDALCETVQALP